MVQRNVIPLYCPTVESQTAIAAAATALGFRVEKLPPDDQAERHGLSLHKHGTPNDVDDMVRPLFELALEHGAEYDGWGAPVVKAGD